MFSPRYEGTESDSVLNVYKRICLLSKRGQIFTRYLKYYDIVSLVFMPFLSLFGIFNPSTHSEAAKYPKGAHLDGISLSRCIFEAIFKPPRDIPSRVPGPPRGRSEIATGVTAHRRQGVQMWVRSAAPWEVRGEAPLQGGMG